MKGKVFFRSLALTALAFFLFTFTALAEPAPDPTPAPVYATAASISCLSKTLAPGETFTLSKIRVFPENEEQLQWQTSNAGVASISETDGSLETTVTALKSGRATISLVGASSKNVLAKCQVTVRTVKITSMAISPKTLVLAPGRSSALSVSIKPSSATFKTVRWVSSDPEVLSFSGAGAVGAMEVYRGESVTVYARAEGKVTVSATAISANGAILKTTYRTVTVKTLSVTKVTLPKTKTLYLEDPNTASWQLTATVSPALVGEDIQNAITYYSSAPGVAEINETTGVLTPKMSGTTYVTASVGGKTSNRCKVTVASKAIKSLSITTPDDVPVVLDPTDPAQLTAVTNPSYASNRDVRWSSDNESVATVDKDTGLVTAGSTGGAATITCQSLANAKVKASIRVHVRGGAHSTITITAAGDAVLGGDQRSGKVVANPRSYQAFKAVTDTLTLEGKESLVFWNVKNFFGGDTNISTLNLEGTLTLKDTRDDKKPFVFQGRPEWARTILKAAGIDAVNMANNHSYDVGKDGYEGTVRALSKPDLRIGYYGNGHTDYVTKNGVKVAFLGYVSRNAYITRMRSEIQSAAKKADIVVVHFHWTDKTEFKYASPSSRQQYLAHYAINCGADLVIGEHTHRLSGIERYKGKYIVYDLGNFVTMASNPINQFGPDNEYGKYDYDSMIYRQAFNVWEDGFVEPADITIIPCAITSQYDQLINDAQPTPYTDPDDINRVMATLRKYSPSPTDFDTFPINLR